MDVADDLQETGASSPREQVDLLRQRIGKAILGDGGANFPLIMIDGVIYKDAL